jgi:hypothetical protein
MRGGDGMMCLKEFGSDRADAGVQPLSARLCTGANSCLPMSRAGLRFGDVARILIDRLVGLTIDLPSVALKWDTNGTIKPSTSAG